MFFCVCFPQNGLNLDQNVTRANTPTSKERCITPHVLSNGILPHDKVEHI